MITPHFFVGIFLILVGFLARWYPNLIAGYNSLPEEQKKEVDVDRLSNRFKVTFIIMGILVAISPPILESFTLSHYVVKTNIAIILIASFSLFIKDNYKK